MAWPQAELRLLAAAVDSSLAIMGIIFCTLWIGQIRDFKSLNNAKFEVLNAIAPRVAFGKEDDERISATPFAKEWEILQRQEETRAPETPHIVALRPSNLAAIYEVSTADLLQSLELWKRSVEPKPRSKSMSETEPRKFTFTDASSEAMAMPGEVKTIAPWNTSPVTWKGSRAALQRSPRL